MIKIGILGATGRVGQLLVSLIKNSSKATLGAVYFKGKNEVDLAPAYQASSIDEFLAHCDAVIDFSSHEGTEELLCALVKYPKPCVIGTTGLNTHQLHLLADTAIKMPILYATNMSLGVAILNKLVALTSEKLRDFDIEITEMHHRHKKDAPSGTALTLATSAAKARSLELDPIRISGRDGIIGERTKEEISVMALRGGDIVGEHIVGFYEDGEYLRLQHTATSRETFAKGALKALFWVNDQPNGLYSINDCLGI
jgi:4-hydroxy-tetrahydrodipicolinate reductase